VHLNLLACLLDCGQIALTIRSFTVRSKQQNRVPPIGRSSFGCNYMLALLMPDGFFLPPNVQLYLAIWSAPLACRSIPARANWFVASLLFPSRRIVVLKASSAPQTSLPRLAMAVNVSPPPAPLYPTDPTLLLFKLLLLIAVAVALTSRSILSIDRRRDK
jgi:hypothetical protein